MDLKKLLSRRMQGFVSIEPEGNKALKGLKKPGFIDRWRAQKPASSLEAIQDDMGLADRAAAAPHEVRGRL